MDEIERLQRERRLREVDHVKDDNEEEVLPERPNHVDIRGLIDELGVDDSNFDPMEAGRVKRVADRETDYQKRRLDRPEAEVQSDIYSSSGRGGGSSYAQRMKEQRRRNEESDAGAAEARKRKEEYLQEKKRRKYGTSEVDGNYTQDDDIKEPPKSRSWDDIESGSKTSTSKRSGWDVSTPRSSNWDVTAPSASKWDQTPVMMGTHTGSETSALAGMAAHQKVDIRNQPWTDELLNSLLPRKGYEIIAPPVGYTPTRTNTSALLSAPTSVGIRGSGAYELPGQVNKEHFGVQSMHEIDPDMPDLKPEDYQYFGELLKETDEEVSDRKKRKAREIMKLLLKIKNGTPPMRKVALRMITDQAVMFGAEALFDQILPLLMSPTLEDQERHLLVKVIDRVLYKLDDLVRPYVHKILVVIEPLLIDEDYFARVEGKEIISNLAKAAGLGPMIATMRPDIDNVDEYVRNTTARAFAVVACALGVPSLVPFLKAVCQSRKSWRARHTGIKIVHHIAINLGCGVLPQLTSLVSTIKNGLQDEEVKVKTVTAFALASLAEAAAPYGIESFDPVLKLLYEGIDQLRGKTLAAYLKAIGFIIPLMDANYASFYTKNIMLTVIREFQSPDEEMKKIVLKVVKQVVLTDGVEVDYIREEILPDFFRSFWIRRMALDRRNYNQLVDTTFALASKVGGAEVIELIVQGLKDESEPFRKMVMETIQKILTKLGSADVSERLEELLVDGIVFAFQEQTSEDASVILDGFGVVINSLGLRAKPYLPQIVHIVKWRLNNRSPRIRQQAADAIAQFAVVLKKCDEEQLMGEFGVVLFEYLGEEYPEVLGSILGALKAIVNVIGMTKMTPPIKDLLPRLTPILKNRHEKVQENCIDLVGRIADRGAEFVSPREWMRICFELLEMLKAHKKGIRRAAVNTFGYIANAVGPQDVLATLLNNLRVQERQNRVCTTVAIAIVAETCQPYTVLPALMNEYRVPEMNVQNGVLKSMSFLFEYIGEMGKDYIYAVVPLLEDALIDRDMVHRQTACTTIKHLALGVFGLGVEDALIHLMNALYPNIFETSPHVINAVVDAIDGIRVSVGPQFVLSYILQGLFHPARKVRNICWRIYNNIYIGAQDAMVPCYPRIPSDEFNNYDRPELEYFL